TFGLFSLVSNAQQNVVTVGILRAEVVCVVCGDEGNVQLAGKFDEALVYDPLVGNAVVCQFEVEPVRSEGIAVPGCNLARLVQAISAYELGNFATHAAGKGHEVVLEKR